MAKASDKSIPFTVRLANSQYVQLLEYCRQTGATRAGGVARAIEFFFASVSITTVKGGKPQRGTDWRAVAK